MPANNQGKNLSDSYKFVPRSLIFLTSGKHVLLLRGAPEKRLWANLFNGIGGHLERGEDVLSSAYRELKEETGLIPQRLWLCGVITVDVEFNIGICIYVFRGETEHLDTCSTKEGTPLWIPFDEISKLPLVEDLGTILPRVLSMKPVSPPFFAHYSYSPSGDLTISFG